MSINKISPLFSNSKFFSQVKLHPGISLFYPGCIPGFGIFFGHYFDCLLLKDFLGFPLFLSLNTADQVDNLCYFSALFFRTCHPCPSGSCNVLKAASFLSIQINVTDTVELKQLKHKVFDTNQSRVR